MSTGGVTREMHLQGEPEEGLADALLPTSFLLLTSPLLGSQAGMWGKKGEQMEAWGRKCETQRKTAANLAVTPRVPLAAPGLTVQQTSALFATGLRSKHHHLLHQTWEGLLVSCQTAPLLPQQLNSQQSLRGHCVMGATRLGAFGGGQPSSILQGLKARGRGDAPHLFCWDGVDTIGVLGGKEGLHVETSDAGGDSPGSLGG